MAKTKKRAKKVVLPIEIGLKVLHERYTEETSEVNPDDSWSRASTSSTWSVDGIHLTKDDYPDETACFPVEAGDDVYLVYAVSSTGDSFGHDENARITFIDVFKSEYKASVAARKIHEHHKWYKSYHSNWEPITAKQRKALAKKYKSEYHVTIIRENEKPHDVYASWNGYFDNLSYVEVVHFVVDANKRQRY